MNLACQKHLFNLEEDVIYLNGAYMSPMLQSVENAGIEGIKKKRTPSKFTVDDFFSGMVEARDLTAQLLNIRDTERICIVPSASYGLANAARNIHLGRGESICVLGDQFPSNYYIWERIANENSAHINVINSPDTVENRGQKWNEKLLESIKANTKIVAMSHVHWADGTLFDLKSIRKRCDEVGARLIIDGTQSFGALPFDQEEIKADVLIAASYKWMFGPYSIGIAYYNKSFDYGTPIEESWINRLDSDDFKSLVNYQNNYRPGAQRYGVGESSNFVLLPMLNAALKQLLSWEPHRFQQYCKELSDPLIQQLMNLGFSMEDNAYRVGHIFGIRLPSNMDFQSIEKRLRRNLISVSFRGNNIRVSPSVYNVPEDLSIFANCLSKP